MVRDAEIDLIIGRPGRPYALVEIKSTTKVDESCVSTMVRLAKDIPNSECYCLSLDPVAKSIEGVACLPWMQGIDELLSS